MALRVTKVARAAVDFARINSKLGLGPETLSTVAAFRRRHEEAKRAYNQFQNAQVEIDFEHYRSVLENKSIVDQLSAARESFEPESYDVEALIDAIETFEEVAVSEADAAEDSIAAEANMLDRAIQNIQETRPVEELSSDDVMEADPKYEEILTKRIRRGEYNVPGFEEKFGNMAVL